MPAGASSLSVGPKWNGDASCTTSYSRAFAFIDASHAAQGAIKVLDFGLSEHVVASTLGLHPVLDHVTEAFVPEFAVLVRQLPQWQADCRPNPPCRSRNDRSIDRRFRLA